MTAVREALTLPLLFLTVVLLGGLRLGDPVQVAAPSVFALVVASLLLAALVQSGTLAPDRLMSQHRSPLANMTGLVVLTTAFAASAQALDLVTPESGLPSMVFGLFLLVAVLQLLAAELDRVRLVRALAVTLGAAFLLKFVVLAALSAPAESTVARALQLLFEGVTLGVVSQADAGPGAGYLAFLVLALYLLGILLLPSAGWSMRSFGPMGLGPTGKVPPGVARAGGGVAELPD